MKIVNLPRQGGKTTELIRLMKQDEWLMYLAPTVKQAQTAWSSYGVEGEKPLERNRFISVSQLRDRSTPIPGDTSFVIDEADVVISMLLSFEVEAIALTGEEK